MSVEDTSEWGMSWDKWSKKDPSVVGTGGGGGGQGHRANGLGVANRESHFKVVSGGEAGGQRAMGKQAEMPVEWSVGTSWGWKQTWGTLKQSC